MSGFLEAKQQDTRAEDKLFNFRPILFIAVALCVGILVGFLQIVYQISAWWTCVLIPFVCAPLYFCESWKRVKRTFVALLCVFVSFLIGLFAFQAQIKDFSECNNYDGEYAVLGTVVEKADYEEYSRIVIKDISIEGTKEKGKLVAYLPATFAKDIELCDKVLLRGTLKTKNAVTDDYGLRTYAIGDNIRFSMSSKTCTAVGRSFNPFLWIRGRIQEVVYAGMDEVSASVTLAVLTGDTSGMDEGLLNNVRRGGIAHIFAVSGLHIGALYVFSRWLVSKTKCSKLPRFIIVASVLFLYSGVCGFSPSVIRALVTCLVFYATSLFAFGSDNLERIALSAIIVLLLSPTALFEIGFQLSFVACLGIALLSRPLRIAMTNALEWTKGLFGKRKTKEEKENHPLSVWEEIERSVISFLSVTLSAQIATTPLTVYAFGYLSTWSLLLNCLFVPLISASFSFLLAVVFIACLLPLSASTAILYIPSVLWSAVLLIFEVVEFSAVTIDTTTITVGAFVCYYLGLTFLTDKWNVTNKLRITFLIAFLLSFCGLVCLSSL